MEKGSTGEGIRCLCIQARLFFTPYEPQVEVCGELKLIVTETRLIGPVSVTGSHVLFQVMQDTRHRLKQYPEPVFIES